MAREIPEVVRAAAGLAATVVDEARKLPETLPGLPVRAIGMAMQHAMKVQQTYAGLVARGDELLVGLRGEAEPGLATFDDDEPGTGFRDSAFDRAGGISDEEVADLPDDPAADAVVAAVDDLSRDLVEDLADDAADLADGADRAQEVLSDEPAEAPGTEEVLEELAIDEVVPEVADTDPLDRTEAGTTAADDAVVTEDSGALERALLESEPAPAAAAAQPDGGESVDVLTPDGEVATVEAAVTDEGIAAVEGADADVAVDEGGSPVAAATGVRTDVGGPDTGETDAAIAEGAAVDAVGETSEAPTDDPQGGSEVSGAQAAGAAPVDGYDSFSIAQLRGRLRGYQLTTVSELLAYEEATRARDPYLRMLRNRLEKLEEQAVESSPLAPRGT
ncbi:lipid droplet-associated protein [Blastococcus sp. KM273128]|uniref:lipid droplet-associated protein n=1 Tax=Blastococcus sp. KM273128 TaxID=2570314 RepID=UPI001F32D5F6|nr:lipid droplet-associated protein [Blastococcus sp. KM273128]